MKNDKYTEVRSGPENTWLKIDDWGRGGSGKAPATKPVDFTCRSKGDCFYLRMVYKNGDETFGKYLHGAKLVRVAPQVTHYEKSGDSSIDQGSWYDPHSKTVTYIWLELTDICIEFSATGDPCKTVKRPVWNIWQTDERYENEAAARERFLSTLDFRRWNSSRS